MPRPIISLFLLFLIFLAACQPGPLPPATSPAPVATRATPSPSLPARTSTARPSPAPPATATFTPTPTLAPVLRLGIPEDILTTNVWALFDGSGASFSSFAVQAAYWPGLYTTNQPGYSFLPELAENFPAPIQPEGEYWVGMVRMKNGLVWSDGSPLTAFDVEFTANTALLFRLGFWWGAAYDPAYLYRVEAVDAQTLKFYFTHQPGVSAWQYGALQGPVVSRGYWEEHISPAVAIMQSIQWFSHQSEPYESRRQDALELLFSLDNALEPAAGPFRFGSREPGVYVESVINPAYPFRGLRVESYANGAVFWSQEGGFSLSAYAPPGGDRVWEYTRGPYYERVRYIVTPPEIAAQALQRGEIDFYLSPNGIGASAGRQLQGEADIQVALQVENGFRFVAFNQGRAHLREPVFRSAVACLIDVDDLTRRVLQGQAEPVFSPVLPENHFWHNPAVVRVCSGLDTRQRLERAVGLLKEAGYAWEAEPVWTRDAADPVEPGRGLRLPGGKPFPAVTLVAPAYETDALLADSAAVIAEGLRQLGLVVELEYKEDDGVDLAVYQTGQYDLALQHTRLTVFPEHLCSLLPSGGNPYQYSNPHLDQKCDIFTTTSDLGAARQAAFELQEILVADLPFITLFTTPVYEAWRGIAYPAGRVLDGFGVGLLGSPDLAAPGEK